jgi:hypothetical protein
MLNLGTLGVLPESQAGLDKFFHLLGTGSNT